LDESDLISLFTLSEFLWSVSHSSQPLCAILCFDEVRNREAWNNNILVTSVVHFCPHEGKPSGDGRCCSEREVASCNVKGVFLADGTAKGLRRFCTHHKKTRLVVQNVGSRLGALVNRREIKPLFHLEQAEVGTWSSKAMLRSKLLARMLSHKWLLTGGGGSLRGVLTHYGQSEKTWL
jgi:hypothetical protein